MTKIEWVKNSDGTSGQTWNPLAGCTIKSPGCTNCYAMKMAKRCEAMGIEKYAGTTMTVKGKAVWTGKINFDEKALFAPLKRKKPTMYFVNSMSDLFHEDVPYEWIDKVFAVMALCPQHTFQVLTKRADRMRGYLSGFTCDGARRFHVTRAAETMMQKFFGGFDWPLKNVWVGVSVEDQKRADERIPDLLATPAAVRWLSMEPLLGPVDLTNVAGKVPEYGTSKAHGMDTLTPYNRILRPQLDWIVVGGESGPGAREFDPDWARLIRDQCAEANVPFFMKQMGGANKARMPEIPADLMVREYPNVK